MQIFADLWHPTLLMFLATTSLPIVLFHERNTFRHIDRGYNTILAGACIVALAAFADYFEETPFGHSLVFSSVGYKLDGTILPFLYAPGILLIGYGIAKWLPAVHMVSHEIERRKAAEADLRTLLEEVNMLARRAEEASRSKSDFLATMSHELRTPLNAVIGFTEMLQTEFYNVPEKRQEYLAIVADSGRHLLNIINDILDLSRLEAGKIAINTHPFDLRDLLEECAAYMGPKILEKRLNVTIEGPTIDLTTDRRLMKQILLNLLSNAVKFTPNEGRIALTAVPKDKQVMLSVTDTGIGMTAAEIQRAMEPFVQIDNSLARAHEGTGLGLPLVERFASLLGGEMEVVSEKGVGTTIRLILPRDVQTNVPEDGDFI